MFFLTKSRKKFCFKISQDCKVSVDQVENIYKLTKRRNITESICKKISDIDDYNYAINMIKNNLKK